MQPRVVQNSHIGTIDLDDASNYIVLEEVFIGEKARKCLTDETHLVTVKSEVFKRHVETFGLLLPSMQSRSFLLRMTS